MSMDTHEVQTGLGRTGTMFAFEHASIEPDAIVLSKAIGGGLPLSVVIYDEALDQWAPGAHAGTFRGNQLAMAAGTSTIDVVVGEGLAAHAARMGERLLAALSVAQQEMPWVGEVRGRGLMLGIEIVDERGTPSAGQPTGKPCSRPANSAVRARVGTDHRARWTPRRCAATATALDHQSCRGRCGGRAATALIAACGACGIRGRRACGSLKSRMATSDRAAATTAGANAPDAPQESMK